MPGLTVDELRSFHRIDRDLYTRIVKNLLRDAIDCLQVIAFWLWLEQIGYPNIILKMITLPDTVVNAVIDEAILCLNNLEKDPLHLQTFTDHNNMPVTERLMDQPISFQFIYENKGLAVTGITKMVHDVCLRTFDDIAQEALAANAAAEEEEEQMVGAYENVQDDDLRAFDDIVQNDHQQLDVMGAPHLPVPWFGGLFRPMFQIPVIAVPAHQRQPSFYGLHPHQHLLEQSEAAAAAALLSAAAAAATPLNPQAQPWSPNQEAAAAAVVVAPDDRTMFVTFSRGYHLTEHEVLDFFTGSFGDCIESMHMEVVPSGPSYRQPLYARLVFYNASSIAAILNGKDREKFVINNKHIWCRQYVAKPGKATGGAAGRSRKL